MATKIQAAKSDSTGKLRAGQKRATKSSPAQRLESPEKKVCVTAQVYPAEERALREVWEAQGKPCNGFGRWLLTEALEAQKLRLELDAERSRPAPAGGGLGIDVAALERSLVVALSSHLTKVVYNAQADAAKTTVAGIAGVVDGIAAAVSGRVLPEVRRTREMVSEALGISE